METISKLKRASSGGGSDLREDGEAFTKKARLNESVDLLNNSQKDDSQKTEEYDHGFDSLNVLSSNELDSLPLLEPLNDVDPESDVASGQSKDRTHTSLNCQRVESPENSNNRKNSLLVKTMLIKTPSIQRDAEVIVGIIPTANLCTVYKKLEQNRVVPNRLDVVSAEILDSLSSEHDDTVVSKCVVNTNRACGNEKASHGTDVLCDDMETRDHNINAVSAHASAGPASEKNLAKTVTDIVERDWSPPGQSIFDEVNLVVRVMPNSNPNEVYSMLEELEADGTRVCKVVKLLKTKNNCLCDKSPLKKDSSIPDDPTLRNDPVFRDMRIISKMFPDKDRNEIYAYVEAHHDKKDRVQFVIEELLKASSGSQDQSLPLDEGDSNVASPLKSFHGAGRLHDEVDDLREIFPDCDPNYIFEELEKRSDDSERVKNLAGHMFEKRDYPKLKDVLAKQTKIALKNRLNRLKFNLENFLSKFPEALVTFYDTNKKMNENYRNHCLVQLKNDFPGLKDGFIKSVLESHNYHYTPVRKELQSQQKDLSDTGRNSKKLRNHRRTSKVPLPELPDEFFFHELLFYENERIIREHLKGKEEERNVLIVVAKEKGELYECGCCFDDECLFEDMSTCADGHLFCKQCIRRSAEMAIGEAKTKFPCLTGSCEHEIPLSVLQQVLSSGLFSRLLGNLQEEEIQKAGIPDLETCPYCSFATIMPDPNDKVFRCLNADCLKETCRLCKELNHVPLKCNEVEKQGETNMRTYIETRISEAMLRRCHKCKKYFYKDTGCNKMTCTCGASSCYVCRKPDIDYDHFSVNSECGNVIQAEIIHKREMEKAAEEAKKQYLLDHPDAADLSLKYDPVKHINEYQAPVEDMDDDSYGYDSVEEFLRYHSKDSEDDSYY